MKTKQEILDFYGVEIGKKYRITKKPPILESDIFSVEETTCNYGGLRLIFEGTNGGTNNMALLSECCYEEVKPLVLDEKEREYLQKYVMDNPAFKGKVVRIQKNDNSEISKSYLAIYLNVNNEEIICLPYFTLGFMYKGMEDSKRYTPKELGLEE